MTPITVFRCTCLVCGFVVTAATMPALHEGMDEHQRYAAAQEPDDITDHLSALERRQ